MAHKILVVDDEPDVLQLVTRYLEQEGFTVLTAETGEDALSLARRENPLLMVLDLMLPGMSGLEICRTLKGDPDTKAISIIMLTAKQQEIDRIVGLEMGADDYVTKPFSPRELVLRVNAIVRRLAPPIKARKVISLGPLELDLDLFVVSVNGVPIDLTPLEFKLLSALVERPRQVHSSEALLNQVWGYACSIETRTVDAHMRRLRDKLPGAEEIIMTVRGFGYRIAPGCVQGG